MRRTGTIGGKAGENGNKAYTILQEAAKKGGGHNSDTPFFWDEDLKVYQTKINAEKMPAEYKKAPKIDI